MTWALCAEDGRLLAPLGEAAGPRKRLKSTEDHVLVYFKKIRTLQIPKHQGRNLTL